MKKHLYSSFRHGYKALLCAFVLLGCAIFSPSLRAQCSNLPTPDFSYCYGNNEADVVAFEICPDAGQIVEAIVANGDFEATYDNLTVYEGVSGSGTTGAVLAGPLDGDLTGTIFTASAADNCLIFVSNSDFSVSCDSGSRPALELFLGNTLPDDGIDYSFCYGNSLSDAVVLEVCPDAGQIADLEICAGNMEPTYDFLTVYEGAAGSATGGSALLGPIDGDLTGTQLTATAADNCLIFVIDSDGSVSCESSDTYVEFAIVSLAPPAPVTDCGTIFTDTGGDAAGYGDNESEITTLCPDVAGEAVEITFTEFDVEQSAFTSDCFDVLSVFDGPDNLATSLGDYCGTALPGPFTSTDPSGCITFEFTSNAAVSGSGWSASVACVPGPIAECTSNVVSCNDNLQISLDQNCEITLTPDMILEGGCDDSYYTVAIIDADGNPAGNVIDGSYVNQTITVRVTHNDSGNYCWGTISIEDKIAPEIECPCPVSEDALETITGTLDADDPTFHRPDNGWDPGEECNLEDDNAADNVPYNVKAFYVSEDGVYTFMAAGTGDLWGAIYEGSFDPNDGCANLIYQNDDAAGGLDPELMLQLDMSVGLYYLVTSQYSNTSVTGDYTWTISGPGDVLERNEECTFLCVDLEGVLDGSINGGTPMVSDACGTPDLTFADETTDLGCAGTSVIRTWTATDGSGNSASCDQEIYFRPLEIADVNLPGTVVVECGDIETLSPSDLDDAGYEGFPTISGAQDTYNLDQIVCNLGATYVDGSPVDICAGSYKIVRTWSIFNWCTDDFTTHTQIVKIIDTEGPVIECPENLSLPVSAQSLDCVGLVILPPAQATDICTGEISEVTASTPNGEFTVGAGGAQIGTLGLGTYTITYTATDACGNESSCSFDITMYDDAAPVAICDEHTVVALGEDGNAEICAATFDDGSYDNCNDSVIIVVKRMDSAANVGFTDCVEFDCADIQYDEDGNPVPVMVRMRVYDIAPDAGYPDNLEGRWNECMIEVEVQDKLAPVVTCPPNITLDCGDDYGVEITGEATASDNCSYTLEYTTSGSLNNCGEGTIFRRWTVTDAGGLTDRCTQRIRIENSTPFTENDIVWPTDYTALCTTEDGTEPEDLPAGHDYPGITEDACDLVAVTHEDTFLPISDTACYKILRLWTVIDWCQFDTNSDGQITDGHWQYTQIIKVQDDTAPTITSDCNDFDVCNFEDDCGATAVELILTAEDGCALNLNYSYEIDLNSDGTDDIGGNTNDASGDFENGTHTIYWTVEDGCGNISECEYRFKVSDCKKPSPICINGLATVVMPTTGEIELWASDFDGPGTSGSFDNCTAQEDLRLRIRKVVEGQSALTSVSQVLNLPTNVLFTCEDIGFPNVELYVVDEEGNFDFCTTYAVIQDNSGVCPAGELASIEGTIETEFEEMVEQVNVDVAGNTAVPAFLTGTSGNFAFNGVPMYSNYTVTPEKDINYLNGVTTYDLVLINKHILDLEALDSPYKVIAADANRSGSVTTFDMVQIRRLILNIDTELANNTSWRFVEKAFAFPDATNPFMTTFPEAISFNNLSVNELSTDFIGVKIGDVNGSAIPNSLLGAEDRNFDGTLVFDVNDVTMVEGEEYTVAFQANQFRDLLGYQFALNINDAAEFVDVEAGELTQLSDANFGLTMASEGVVTTSWNDASIASLKDGQTVFTVTVRANKATKLSEVLSLSSRFTAAEAYTADESTLNVALAFNGENGTSVVGTAFELYQNQPNPFKSVTNISFNLPTASAATLTIYDLSGKVVKLVKGDYAKGLNTISIDRTELSASGMLYYQLDTDNDSATMKMILVD